VWQRAEWQGVRIDLLQTANTLRAEEEFGRARGETCVLAHFESPAALVSFLNSREGDLDEKDRIYGVLVGALQGRADWSDLATTILWLGLWPGLDAIYRRKLRYFRRNPDELVSAIGERFTASIQRADLSRINRLAATLARNTERDLVDGLRRGWDHAASVEPCEDDRLEDAAFDARRRAGREASPAVSEEFAFAELRARLLPVVGDDTDLLLAVAVLGENQREAADRLGISHGAARKRYGRALDRATDFLRKDLSHLALKTCVSRSGGTQASKGRPKR
jgi:DNA-directed RNA polymerase specialized sigma24 family protein